ncbi:MAG: DNA primase [Odoribacter sp.]|nr:DNA primase [Odoribacter sp.]
MARIDRVTIDRIMDATDIVDVVGDFVSLKKRGANYWGLCPFHNDRSPSFSVNGAKGIFKCFSCGKAGSAVSFLMDLEGMSYVEAIKWLGKKYNIEIQEKAMTGAEREAEQMRESMFAVNAFAMEHFEKNLKETSDGVDIGLSYFRERGISDSMISRFHLGYALEKSDDLLNSAVKAGFNEKYIVDTGLCIKTDNGRIYDRFKGRVIYPVHSLSGRVVAFGGRTLRKEKTVPKYVNSPESVIYSKSRELYGMYQARSAIARKKSCILVEGYMDVISMHQAGVENVVASSGTALTEGQVAMIKRFADKVILIYDSDAAGIKAALRGINMFVAAGMSLKLVLLPEGEDPDSFAQSHTSAEVEEYLAANEKDLIGFKTEILLSDSQGDPRRRSEAINDILQTIALIPNVIEQTLYIDECASKVGIAAGTLAAQVKTIVARQREQDFNQAQRRRAEESLAPMPGPSVDTYEEVSDTPQQAAPVKPQVIVPQSISIAEEDIIKYVLRYGPMYLCDVAVNDVLTPMTVIGYIEQELAIDDIHFSVPEYARLWELALEITNKSWQRRHDERKAELEREKARLIEEKREEIRQQALDVAAINAAEEKIVSEADAWLCEQLDDFDSAFVRDRLVRHEDRRIIDLVVHMTADPVVLSKMHPKVDRRSDLCEKLPVAVYALKGALLRERIRRLTLSLDNADADAARDIMAQIMELKMTSMEFDRCNGEIVVTPGQIKL